MKKFFGEFKKFISRGNVIDMAVGVVIGSAFTKIVNSVVNDIIMPLISLATGGVNLVDRYTILKKGTFEANENGSVIYNGVNGDWVDRITLNWGQLLQYVLDFFLIAICLFVTVWIINKVREGNKKLTEDIKEKTLDRHERKELKQAGVDVRDKKAVKAYFEQKKLDAERQAEEEKLKAEEEARLQREQNPTTEDLLKQILAEIKKD